MYVEAFGSSKYSVIVHYIFSIFLLLFILSTLVLFCFEKKNCAAVISGKGMPSTCAAFK